MKNMVRGIIGVLLMVISVGLIMFWEVYGRATVLYDDILVLTEDVEKGEVITNAMLTYVKREGSSIVEGALVSTENVLGKAATSYIPGGVQLVEPYFEEPGLVVGEEQYIFQLPNKWLMAYPHSLRRGDRIFFYAIRKGLNQSLPEKQGFTDTLQHEDVKGEPVAEVTVAYVKDSANREVITLSEDGRYNGSGKISEIEIIVDVDTVNTLRACIEDGNVFLLLYQ